MNASRYTAMLRPKDAAGRYGVSKRTLARWVASGLVGKSKVGGVTFVVAADIEDVIAAPLAGRRVVPMAARPEPSNDWERDPFWAAPVRRAIR